MVVELLLRAVEIKGRHRWRWVLTDPESGTPLADHLVELDPAAPETRAFEDLYRHLRWQAEPDRRAQSEAELLAQLGTWIGQQVLGETIGRKIAAQAPVTVRVVDAPELLLFRPLELAYVDGTPLARRDVSLVYEIRAPGMAKQPVGERLRMVALFSLPTESSALALRRERYELTRLIRRLAARRGRAVDLEVLQYGVTRDRLAEAMTAGGGPDVLHLSGHGRTGELHLERPDGTADPVPAAELLELLAPARRRVKLAVVSACESAAGKVAETLGLLGLAEQAAQAQQQADAEQQPALESGIAHRLTTELDCAVVAMRYPVSDEFAIRLADQLYDGLFRLDLPLDRALPRAVRSAAGDQPSLSCPAISIAVPGLFGARGAGLALTPPRGKGLRTSRMGFFPDEPERFVGRAKVMAEATAALAPDSGHTAVLLHGMAGAGKTACALELAYRHEHTFADGLVFWQAPTRDGEFGAALTGLASAMERQVDDLAMVDKIGNPDDFAAFLPRLTELLADNGILLVLDNLETLLTSDGTWRDDRWAQLIPALTNHNGFSRVVFTSRTRPTELDDRVLVRPVHALSRDESVLLARELPHLRALLHTEPAPTRQPEADVAADRGVVTEVLRLVQGHPKLLELADAAAADRTTLATHLAAARAAAQAHDGALSTFFAEGESSLDADGFYSALSTWTTSTLTTLPDDTRLLFQMLCLLEDDDRRSDVLAGNWVNLWRRLERPGDPPAPDELLKSLTAAALVHPHRDKPVRYEIHPGVSEAVRAAAPERLRPAVDAELAAWWYTGFERARTREGGEHTGVVVQAGLAAVPYLLRLHDWDTAATLLEEVHLRDRSPPVVQAVLPHLDRIATTTGKPDHAGVYARVLASVDPARAEPLLRQVIDTTTAAGDHRTASTAAGILANLLVGAGRLPEALAVADQQVGHIEAAGLGPWTQLAGRGLRLAILFRMGEVGQVLAEVETLRGEMAGLSDQRGPDEAVDPWRVREGILHLGVTAAAAGGRWQQALDLNTEILAGQQARGAGPHQLASTRFDDYGPLLRLGQVDEADTLLQQCQQVFEDHQDIPALGAVLGARADVADERDRPTDAVGFTQAALRHKYVHPDPAQVAVSHHNLANYLSRTGGNPAGQVAHRLAAALLRHLAGMQHDLANSVRWLADDLRTLGDQAPTPATVAELAAQVEQVEGVHFAELVQRLQPDPAAVPAALDEILQAAQELPTDPEPSDDPPTHA